MTTDTTLDRPALGLVTRQLGTTGRWQVTTGTSTYLLDLDARTVTRTPGGFDKLNHPAGLDHPAALRHDGEPVRLHSVVLAEVGSPLVVTLEPVPGVLTLRRSTPVRLIARAGPVPRGRRRPRPAS